MTAGFTTERQDPDLRRVSAALVRAGQRGPIDGFRGRLMFPIHDELGNCIAFGARALKDGDEPKYLNSPESPLFSKGRTLYALHHARRAIIETKHALIVEGYVDALALHAAGVHNVVATLGTALTPAHLQRLFRYTSALVFCFDGDEAGEADVLFGAVLHDFEGHINLRAAGFEAEKIVLHVARIAHRVHIGEQAGERGLNPTELVERKVVLEPGLLVDDDLELVVQHFGGDPLLWIERFAVKLAEGGERLLGPGDAGVRGGFGVVVELSVERILLLAFEKASARGGFRAFADRQHRPRGFWRFGHTYFDFGQSPRL